MATSAIPVLISLGILPHPLSGAATVYAETIAALKKGVDGETKAHQQYVLFSRLAKADGYKGLAYLYTALAASELIHAQNYIRVLATLGEFKVEPEVPEIPVGTAKENLIYAAESEVNSIENTYPDLLRLLETEGHADAIAAVEYSWASHKQHRDIIAKIRRWSPSFFKTIARKIDESTDRYYVCRICGSTVTEAPKNACPVCKEPPGDYRLISPDRFL
jgi:rubrerythrin